jgi:hypothetical protein
MSVEPEPRPEPGGAPGSARDVCPLCGTPAAAGDTRCRECGMTLDGVGARVALFSRRSLWFWAAGLLVLYLVVLAVVALVR